MKYVIAVCAKMILFIVYIVSYKMMLMAWGYHRCARFGEGQGQIFDQVPFGNIRIDLGELKSCKRTWMPIFFRLCLELEYAR